MTQLGRVYVWVMRWGIAVVLPLSCSLLVPAGPVVASSKPAPAAASVDKGTYFSKTYKTKIRAPNDGWTTKKIIIRGQGTRKEFSGRSGVVLLRPGRYQVTRVYYTLKRPDPNLSLKSLPKGTQVTYDGSVRAEETSKRSVWKWDPLLDQNKGLAYPYGPYEDPVAHAQDIGGTYLGRLACLREDLGRFFYFTGSDYSADRVYVAEDDPRIYTPPVESPYFVTPESYSYAPDTPGQRQWSKGTVTVSPCVYRLAFRLGQAPSDYDFAVYGWNQWKQVFQLPDGNWYQTTEEYVSSFRWRGTVTAMLPSGAVYKGAALGPSSGTETGAASGLRRGTLDLQPMPGWNRTKRIARTFPVKAVNAGWASNAEVRAIRMGMTKSQVFRIIGSAGSLEVRASGLEVRQWYGRWGGLMVTVGFSAGRVASIVY